MNMKGIPIAIGKRERGDYLNKATSFGILYFRKDVLLLFNISPNPTSLNQSPNLNPTTLTTLQILYFHPEMDPYSRSSSCSYTSTPFPHRLESLKAKESYWLFRCERSTSLLLFLIASFYSILFMSRIS